MNKTLKKVVFTFLHGILAVSFLVHISYIGYFIVYPDQPDIKVFKTELKNIDFPLSFFLCAKEHENVNARYKKYGYNDIHDFFGGKSMYQDNVIGWKGHKPNGTTFDSFEGK